jgi:hypothetical protein
MTRKLSSRRATNRASSTERPVTTPPLTLVLDDPDFGGGTRTTLRVPDSVAVAAQALAEELGTSKNDALIRLAVAGARVIEHAREIAATSEARWEALVAHALGNGTLPEPDEMRAASFDLRDRVE